MAVRSDVGLELIARNKNAFVLLYVIAQRAQRTASFNRYNLAPGEALIGDHDSYDMSEREYRTAKEILSRAGFATFKTTNKGTTAKLINSMVFDINAEASDEQKDEQPTTDRRASDEQPTTSKNANKKKNVKRSESISLPTEEEFFKFTDSLRYPRAEALCLFAGCAQKGWRDANGVPIRDWKKFVTTSVENWRSVTADCQDCGTRLKAVSHDGEITTGYCATCANVMKGHHPQ